MSDNYIVNVTENQFSAEVLAQPGTVLVDFYTPWCPPCRKVLPVLQALVDDERLHVKIVKLDAGENAALAAEHQVLTVPTFLLYRDGRKLGQVSGYRSKDQFEQWIAESVGAAA